MAPLVGDRMSSPVVTASADTTVRALAATLAAHGFSALPIVRGEQLVGVVSTTDLVRERARLGAEAEVRHADAFMTKDVVTARPDEPLVDALRRLVAARVHRLVVVDEGVVVGILSTRDVLGDAIASRIPTPISAVMSSPAITVDIGDTVDVATASLAASNVHGLVVVEGSFPVGVFTHHEALSCRTLPPVLGDRPVEEVMSYETICLDGATPLYRAAGHAVQMQVRRLLVVDHRRLVGVLSCLDLVDALARASTV